MRQERLRVIAANLARVYVVEPVKTPEWVKQQVRRLKEVPLPKPRDDVSPG